MMYRRPKPRHALAYILSALPHYLWVSLNYAHTIHFVCDKFNTVKKVANGYYTAQRLFQGTGGPLPPPPW